MYQGVIYIVEVLAPMHRACALVVCAGINKRSYHLLYLQTVIIIQLSDPEGIFLC